ncbi:T9SS type A sorting domain-containing protein [Rubricoccus marinus]|uniref:T9SS type A sorting domain-containing protein n=1 Tax=Rubricoccus marinus TaxID=716817 RepID=UPI0015C5C7D9|nr:T9SS type A sorting domain-containing protein [Rubricoccus marinus]
MRGTRTQGFLGSDDPTPADGFCSVYTYNETAASFGEGYECVTDATVGQPVLGGVMAYVYNDDDPTTPGVQGGFPKTLTAHGFTGSIPSRYILTYTDDPDRPAYQEGWHLVGNPHPSPMDWDAVGKAGASDVAYVYDPNYLGGDYRSWSSGTSSGDLSDGIIPYMQSFFVKMNAAGFLSNFRSARVDGDQTGTYGKTEPATASSLRLGLAVAADGVETPMSAAFVAPTEGAALGEDDSDAYRLTPGAWPRATVSTMTLGADPVPLAINALPADASGEITLPVEIAAEGYAAGDLEVVLTWTGALPEGWSATLTDRHTGEQHVIEPGGEVRLTLGVPSAAKSAVRPRGLGLDMLPPQARSLEKASSGGAISSGDRLALVLTPANAVSTSETPEASFGLGAPAPNPARGLVRVPYTLSASGEARVSVYDALGREVATLASGAHAAGAHTATLDAGALAPGVYVVRLSTPEAASVQRITVVR